MDHPAPNPLVLHRKLLVYPRYDVIDEKWREFQGHYKDATHLHEEMGRTCDAVLDEAGKRAIPDVRWFQYALSSTGTRPGKIQYGVVRCLAHAFGCKVVEELYTLKNPAIAAASSPSFVKAARSVSPTEPGLSRAKTRPTKPAAIVASYIKTGKPPVDRADLAIAESLPIGGLITEGTRCQPCGLHGSAMATIAQSAGLPLTARSLSPGAAADALRTGAVNFVVGLAQTPPRLREFAFAGLCYGCKITALAKRGTVLRSPSDLIDGNLRIAFGKDEAAAFVLKDELRIPAGRRREVVYDREKTVLDQIYSPDVDAVVTDAPSIHDCLKRPGGPRAGLRHLLVHRPIAAAIYGIMFRKGDPAVADWIDAQLATVRAQPAQQERERRAFAEYAGMIFSL